MPRIAKTIEQIPEKQYITSREARLIVRKFGFHISLTSLIEWCKKYKIGDKIAGRWYIEKELLMKLMKKETNREIKE